MYELVADERHPKLVVFMIDESTSMGEPYAGEPKNVWVTRSLNQILRRLVEVCSRPKGVRNYVHVALIGYSGPERDKPDIRSLLPVETADWVIPIADLAALGDDPKYIGADDLAEYVKKTKANGWTPMGSAMREAGNVVGDWLEVYPDACAPVIINVSDGKPTDDDLEDGPVEEWVEILDEHRTEDGAALLITAGVPESDHELPRCVLPTADQLLDDPELKRLWTMSSALPPELLANAIQRGLLQGGSTSNGRRLYAHASDKADLIRLFEFGSFTGGASEHGAPN